MSLGVKLKDKDETRDFSVDWSAHLASGETITSTNFVVPAGLTLVSQASTSTVATVRVSGGVAGTIYTVLCQVTTSSGEQLERSFGLNIQDL